MNKTKKEYSASHSVDTDWFAVDRNGNLGYMESTYDAPLPVTISYENIQDDDYNLHCFQDMASCAGDNCYYLDANPDDVARIKAKMADEDSGGFVFGERDLPVAILTDGRSIRNLMLWKDKGPDSHVFFLDKQEDIAVLFGFPSTENTGRDIQEKRIEVFGAYFSYWSLGFWFEGSFFDSVFSSEDSDCRVRIKVNPKSEYHSLVPLDASFEDGKQINLFGAAFLHFPSSSDNYPLEQLRNQYDSMSPRERELELFKSIEEAGTAAAPSPFTRWTERKAGILVSEYDVSPDARNVQGITAIEYARERYKTLKKNRIARIPLLAIIRNLEHKEKLLCQGTGSR